ncbi:MAG TPA: hypothetical protein PKC21_04850 [Oligoflexia bacterium]|nr:hypothetical protein [Oligoflexia bacterium]HMR24666.1 hypothetical protein [Oligoflexia bacterium]
MMKFKRVRAFLLLLFLIYINKAYTQESLIDQYRTVMEGNRSSIEQVQDQSLSIDDFSYQMLELAFPDNHSEYIMPLNLLEMNAEQKTSFLNFDNIKPTILDEAQVYVLIYGIRNVGHFGLAHRVLIIKDSEVTFLGKHGDLYPINGSQLHDKKSLIMSDEDDRRLAISGLNNLKVRLDKPSRIIMDKMQQRIPEYFTNKFSDYLIGLDLWSVE